MKVRADHVTNSSSSSFICLKVDESLHDLILRANGTCEELLVEHAADYGEDEVSLQGNGINAVLGEGYICYIGRDLTEKDFEDKTLTQLKDEFIKDVNATYGMQITDKDIEFDYGEIYR